MPGISIQEALAWPITGSSRKKQFRADPWQIMPIVSSEGENIGVTFRRIPFDIKELTRIVRSSGSPMERTGSHV